MRRNNSINIIKHINEFLLFKNGKISYIFLHGKWKKRYQFLINLWTYFKESNFF